MNNTKMTVNIQLNKNILSAKVVGFDDTAKYAFQLIQDGNVKEKTDYSKKNEYTAHLTETGIYFVSAFIQTQSKNTKYHSNSKTIEYFTDGFKNKYIQFLHKSRHEDSFGINLPFIKNEYPFNDFAIICSKTEIRLPKLDFNSLSLTNAGKWQRILLTNGSFKNSMLFSGMLEHNDRFIYGDKDAEYLPEIIAGHTGCFTCVQANGVHINLFTDFFNFCHLYYYATDSLIIVSNRYHLLLTCLSPHYFRIGLNTAKATALLTSHKIPTMLHNITFEMDIKGVYQLPAYYNINLTEEGLKLEENEFYHELSKNYEYTEKVYRYLLETGKEDIIQNINTIFNDTRFKNVLIDLSGGMDSRTVYAALTNVTSNINKAYINTLNTSKEDISISTYINHKFGYSYDTTSEKRLYKSIYESDYLMRSFFIGTNFEHNPMLFTNHEKGSIKLTGAGGDIIMRPFYSRQYLNENFKDVEDCVNHLINQYMPYIRGDYELAYKKFKELYTDTLTEIPIKSPQQKLDMLWLMLGNGYHFFTEIKNNVGIIEYSILMSKNLFRARLMSFEEHKNAKMHSEVITLLNKTLAGIPYDKDINNIKYSKSKISAPIKKCKATGVWITETLFKKNISKTWKAHIINISVPKKLKKEVLMKKCDLREWEGSRKKKYENITNQPLGILEAEINWQLKNYKEILYESLQDNLLELLLLCPYIERVCGMSLYHYVLINKENDKFIRVLYNKVMSLLDQIRIICNINNPEKATYDTGVNWTYLIHAYTKNVGVMVKNSNTLKVTVKKNENSPAYAQLFDNIFDKAPSDKYHEIATLHGKEFIFSCDISGDSEGRMTVFLIEYDENVRKSTQSKEYHILTETREVVLICLITEGVKLFKIAFLFNFSTDVELEICNVLIKQK